MYQNLGIYRIDRSHRLLNQLSSCREVIGEIIISSYKRLGFKRSFNIDSLKETTKDHVRYYLHLFNTDGLESDWKSFLPIALTQNQDFIHKKLSLLLFIESDGQLFCIVGGNSYQVVVPFIDHSFGLNTYARIMIPEEDELTSIKSRGITGTRAGINEQFRDNYRIIDFIKFGKVPQVIQVKLSLATTNLHFAYLKKHEDDRLQINVGKSFKIKKGIDFETLHEIILELGHILELAPNDYLSSYKEIKDASFIDNHLRPILITHLFNDAGVVHETKANRFEHDFCNPNDIEKFYEADEYRLKERSENDGYMVFNIINDRTEIYDAVLRRAIEVVGINDRFNFMVYLQGVRITCYQSGKKTVGSSFLFHISSEFSLSGQPYFLVDTKWYKLRDSFISDLKTNTRHVLKTYRAPEHILTEPWDKAVISREQHYNELYNHKPGYIVVDTIIVDGIELCDIFFYDEQNIYLIHVKYGFSSNMRELTNQILISARRLRESLNSTEKEMLKKVYHSAIQKGHSVDEMMEDEFLNLFSARKINYILAFTSQLAEDLLVEDHVDRFDSNIARFSLIQCSSEMRSNYYDMYTHQIRRY